ncbi:MAG: YraN family protein [Actinobacteria bacterium]|nr:YraN family protein [Actinomycetota bacterium]
MDARTDLGRTGEDAAERLYRTNGFCIVERNYRCKAGEIDLVVRRGPLVVFCEVKARRSDRWGEPSEAVHYAKQARLRRLAAAWLADRRPGSVDIRFDVVGVIVRRDRIEVRHIPDAF